MAATSNEALKQQAIIALQQGRKEISTDTRMLRKQLSPQHMAKKMLRRHTTGVTIASAVAGIGLGYLLFRQKEPVRIKVGERAAAPPQSKPGFLKRLLEFSTPLLFKKVLTPYLTSLLQRRQPMPPAYPDPSTPPEFQAAQAMS